MRLGGRQVLTAIDFPSHSPAPTSSSLSRTSSSLASRVSLAPSIALSAGWASALQSLLPSQLHHKAEHTGVETRTTSCCQSDAGYHTALAASQAGVSSNSTSRLPSKCCHCQSSSSSKCCSAISPLRMSYHHLPNLLTTN
jgi:hypothetical protein